MELVDPIISLRRLVVVLDSDRGSEHKMCIIWYFTCSVLCESELKWFAIGVSLCVGMSRRCSLILILYSRLVSPTYCFLHSLNFNN